MSNSTKTGLKTVVALVVIAGAVAFLMYYRSTRVRTAPHPVRVATIDIETGKLVEVVHNPGEQYPLTNPDTGKKTLYMAYVSTEGKFLFPGQGMVTNCPETRSQNVGALSVGAEDYEEYKKYPVKLEYFRR